MLRFFYKHIFRMPTFNDLYYNFVGNSALRPEYARQYNAGITWSRQFRGGIRQFSISADGYYNTIKDKIIAVPNKNLFIWTMLNLGKVDIKGLDITTEVNGNISPAVRFTARIAYTWQQALDMTDPASVTYKNRIPYTPDHSGSGLLSFQYHHWSAGYSMLFAGTRYTLGENNPSNELDGWATHDLFASCLLHLKFFAMTIKGEVNNITDQRYDIVRYFPMPGRSFKIGLLFNHL
jgi:outer membrane receptor protein involved in Fe transport